MSTLSVVHPRMGPPWGFRVRPRYPLAVRMCGISGMLGSLRTDRATLQRMNDGLRHRGPDGEGFFWSDDVGLGMRRLAIIDVAGGDQPIYNEDRSVCVVFNGEIYNFLDLRQELE